MNINLFPILACKTEGFGTEGREGRNPNTNSWSFHSHQRSYESCQLIDLFGFVFSIPSNSICDIKFNFRFSNTSHVNWSTCIVFVFSIPSNSIFDRTFNFRFSDISIRNHQLGFQKNGFATIRLWSSWKLKNSNSNPFSNWPDISSPPQTEGTIKRKKIGIFFLHTNMPFPREVDFSLGYSIWTISRELC